MLVLPDPLFPISSTFFFKAVFGSAHPSDPSGSPMGGSTFGPRFSFSIFFSESDSSMVQQVLCGPSCSRSPLDGPPTRPPAQPPVLLALQPLGPLGSRLRLCPLGGLRSPVTLLPPQTWPQGTAQPAGSEAEGCGDAEEGMEEERGSGKEGVRREVGGWRGGSRVWASRPKVSGTQR